MFDGLRRLGEIDPLARRAAGDIAAVHRHPASLRRFEVTASESALRGARSGALIDAPGDAPVSGARVLEGGVGPYAVLAPGSAEAMARTWARAPLQVLARLDVLAGGTGLPGEGAAGRLRLLGEAVRAGGDDALVPQVVHAEIAARGLFGPRSGAVARVAARVAAMASGLDPRGLAVPEPYLYRNRAGYRAALGGYASGAPEGVLALVELLLRAWIDGAREAGAIADAA
ncbi:hypothetical protein [Corynebacterium mastitidis]|uniref:hypothetical protein n=1 Tax=Corynebacterium mastitidis TaxID=161890 RepID=UPI00254AA912|nr:hypothetical protein [Corynebacterium mastitidis]MDK8450420.1 hypothetical protein [Corynebacterium mastitidis]